MRIYAAVCDRCGDLLKTRGDDQLPPLVEVTAKQHIQDVGSLDLCLPCWDAIRMDSLRWAVVTTRHPILNNDPKAS